MLYPSCKLTDKKSKLETLFALMKKTTVAYIGRKFQLCYPSKLRDYGTSLESTILGLSNRRSEIKNFQFSYQVHTAAFHRCACSYFFSDDRPSLETLDLVIQISTVNQPLYFDLYFYTHVYPGRYFYMLFVSIIYIYIDIVSIYIYIYIYIYTI